MTPTIPLSALRGACQEQMRLVRAEWPDGIPLTEAAMERCLALNLSLEWAAGCLLDGPANAEYAMATIAAWAEYLLATQSAKVRYELELTSAAWIEYQRVAAPAMAEYERAIAPTLLCLLRKQVEERMQ